MNPFPGFAKRSLPRLLQGREAMPVSPLTWIFAGLFLLFGLLMLATDAEAGRRFWAGFSVLSLGGFGLSMARDALATGQVRLQHVVIRRAKQPRLFRATVGLIGAAGAGTVIAGLWLLFFKT